MSARLHTDAWRRTIRRVGISALAHPRMIPAATVGLVLVLIALTVFSVTAAVTNARAAQHAQQSAVVSGWAELALDRLAIEEDVVDDLKMRGDEADPDAPAEYRRAVALVQDAFAALRAADADPERQEVVERWGLMHARYRQAVQVMQAVGPTDPTEAEVFEELYLDPHYDPLREALKSEVQRLYADANDALRAVGRFQQAMLVATPVAFGLGLALVLGFSGVLVRGRRLVVAQAEENRHQALHDALTGLPNRTLLRQELQRALGHARPGEPGVTLLLIDLDRFKEINDTLGHRYGDRVLQVVADRLRTSLGDDAVVGRLGGDEFAVVLPGVASVEEAFGIALGVRATMDANIDAEGVSLDVDASIGLVVSGEHGDDVETLLQHADIAMYHAKERGLGVCGYDPELNEHSREQLGLLGELRRAIDHGELVLEFQPKVTLPGLRFCGAEALVRWQHPERGLLPPGLFVPVAERTALIHPLTRYVLDAALAECRRWRDAGRELHVAVNVSVRNLLDDTFLDDVVALLDRRQVPASWLELEVTESAIMADPARARSVLTAFADLGITLSIDDFGAGYTSLAHLSKLPVHTLKIDSSLVSRMSVEPSDALIVRSVIDLAHSLGLRTVAEGVEDAATRDLLGRHGCDVAQGYLFSRPVRSGRLVDWFDAAAERSAAPATAAGTPLPIPLPTPLGTQLPTPVPTQRAEAGAADAPLACPERPLPGRLLTSGTS